MDLLKISSLGRDLFSETKCSCVEKKWLDKGIRIETTVKLTGYNDDYFFNHVNKEFRNGICLNCKREYKYKWTINGVYFDFLENNNMDKL